MSARSVLDARSVRLACALAAMLVAGDAAAWCRTSTLRAPPGECSTGTPLMWCSACAGLSVHVDGSLDIPFAELRREATEAAARWGNVGCPGDAMDPPAFELRVTDDTRVFSGINHTGPNANAIWFNSTWRPDALHRAGTIAITIVSFDRRSGEILDADVELNQRTDDNPNGFTFSIGTPSPENADLPTILTHELGHALGLGHSDQDRAVMWPTAGMGERRLTLNADDIEGVCDIYAFDRRPSLQCDPPGTERRPDLVCNETPYGGFAPALDGGRVVGGCSVGGRSPRARNGSLTALLLGGIALAFRRRPRANGR
jgi:hypothetical protein